MWRSTEHLVKPVSQLGCFESARGWPPRPAWRYLPSVEAELTDDPSLRNPPRWPAVAHPALAALAPAGLVVMAVTMLPPVETLALRYLFVESAQFCALAMVGPALIVLGAPWRFLRLSRGPAKGPAGLAPPGPADRLAAGRLRRPSFARAAGYLAWWAGLCLCWRLPPVLDALARYPVLSLGELAAVSPAGVGLWLELVNSPPFVPRLARPRRAAIAALAMWSTWAIAFVLGFAGGSVVHAYDGAGSSLGTVSDQEITAMLLWLVSACCFVPVIFVSVLTWLRDGTDPGEAPARSGVRGWGGPSRGPSRPLAGQSRW